MRDEKADLAFTDPPYNVNYIGRKKRREQIQFDFLDSEHFTTRFLNTSSSLHINNI